MANLRTSWVWHGEVLEDIVHERETRVTLGTDGATFVTPLFGGFVVFDHVPHCTLLYVAPQMTGIVCIRGVEHDVSELRSLQPVLLTEGDEGVLAMDGDRSHLVFSVQAPQRPSLRPPRLVGMRTLMAAGVFSIVLHAALLMMPSAATARAEPAIAPADLVTVLEDPGRAAVRASVHDALVCAGSSERPTAQRACPMMEPIEQPIADTYDDDPEQPSVSVGANEAIASTLRALELERCAGSRARASRIVLEMEIGSGGWIRSARIQGDVDGVVAACIRGKLRSVRVLGWADVTVMWPLAPPLE